MFKRKEKAVSELSELRAAQERHMEKAKEEEAAREEKKLEGFRQADRQAMEDARSYVPKVAVTDYPTGEFLCFDGREWPVRYIESIEADDVGSAPGMGLGYRSLFARKAQDASIKVTLHSGQSHSIRCNRFQLDALLDALRTAWKTGKE